jgi:magnesium transporter
MSRPVLFMGWMLTATAMAYFQDEVARAVVLSLFVPLIILSVATVVLRGTLL